MNAGKYAEGCPKLADSQRLDPALDTLMHLALCNEKLGKTATAWSEYVDAAAQAHKSNQGDREKFAQSHAQALESKLQKVIIEMPRPPEGVSIKLDGAALPPGVLGTELPLDPGDRALEVTAPGKKPWKQAKLNLGPSAVTTRVQVTLEDDVAAPGPGPHRRARPRSSAARRRGVQRERRHEAPARPRDRRRRHRVHRHRGGRRGHLGRPEQRREQVPVGLVAAARGERPVLAGADLHCDRLRRRGPLVAVGAGECTSCSRRGDPRPRRPPAACA